MNFPYTAPLFTVRGAEDWVALHQPTQIEMKDSQYAHLANLMRGCPTKFKGIPIVFTEAPKTTV